MEKVLKSKGLKVKELEDIWKDISGSEGSVQHLDILTDTEKEIFKTANELNQIWIIEHAYQRQQFVCQAQSVNLFLKQQSLKKHTMNTCSMLMMFTGMV